MCRKTAGFEKWSFVVDDTAALTPQTSLVASTNPSVFSNESHF